MENQRSSKNNEPVAARDLLYSELICVLVLLIGILALSLLFKAPFEEAIRQGEQKAPWIFAGIQTLLHYLPARTGGVLIPGLLFGFWVLLPWVARALPHSASRSAWFSRGEAVLFLLSLSASALLTLWSIR